MKYPDIKRPSQSEPLHTCTQKCFGRLWPKNVEDFLDFHLEPGNIAVRTPSPTRHQRAPMKGRHISRQGLIKHLRGSDFVERVYVAFEVLRMSPRFLAKRIEGKGGRTFTIEGIVEVRLGGRPRHNRRGRPLKEGAPKFTPSEKTGTIYSLWRSFKARHPWPGHCPDPIVAHHLSFYCKVRYGDLGCEERPAVRMLMVKYLKSRAKNAAQAVTKFENVVSVSNEPSEESNDRE